MPAPVPSTVESQGRISAPPAFGDRGDAGNGSGSGADQSVAEPDREDVRRWLARELHDGVAGTLAALLIDMEHLKRRDGEPVSFRIELESFQESTRQVLSDLRRLVYDLRGEPPQIAGFAEALLTMLQEFEARTGIRARLVGADSWPSGVAARAAHNLLRIVEEALHNVRNHSAARSVDVYLACAGSLATLTVRDDGVGHEVVADRGGLGLQGMRERAALVGGDLNVRSAPGNGTTVQAVFPLARLI